MPTTRSIGLMSGTSGDGVDALYLQFDDLTRPHLPKVLGRASLSFTPTLQAELVQPHELRLARIAELHFLLPQLYAKVVRQLPDWADADCVGMHGQTVAHQPNATPPTPRATLQLGSSAVLAAELNLPVVGDMRGVDVALGGQGAPLVPFCHWFFCSGTGRPTLVVNFGGICNLSFVTPDVAEVVGFDVGPGMMLSDAFAARHSEGSLRCDRDGTLSQGGRRIAELYAAIVHHPFVDRVPPKSAGREEFGHVFAESLWQKFAHLAAADVAFTLVEASVAALVRTVQQNPALRGRVERIVFAGGGAHNPTLRRCAAAAFAPLAVEVHADGVLAPENHEPAAMALIAARTLRGLASNLPQVTGARHAAVLGHLHAPPIARRRGK